MQGGMLSEENCGRVKGIIAYFREKHGIALTEGNSAAFITHLCSALERISQGEVIAGIDPKVYEETKSEPTFEKALAISRDLLEMNPILPEAELDFITVHIGVVLASLE
jgi:transcriptional antiterminator